MHSIATPLVTVPQKNAIPVCRCKKALDGGCPAKRMRPCSSPVVFRPASKSSMVLLPVPGGFASKIQSLNAAQSATSPSPCDNRQLALSRSGSRMIQEEYESHRLLSLSNAKGRESRPDPLGPITATISPGLKKPDTWQRILSFSLRFA